jgi:magnesium chelatase family protein
LICSPRVFGSKSYGFFINDLSETEVNGKKATQPCPCGYAGDESGKCHCSADLVDRYRSRISGPLLDRIDLHIKVSRPRAFLLQHEGQVPESSQQVRERVLAARAIQHQRAGKTNAQLDGSTLKQFCRGRSDFVS